MATGKFYINQAISDCASPPLSDSAAFVGFNRPDCAAGILFGDQVDVCSRFVSA
jgi:hypothetical protein